MGFWSMRGLRLRVADLGGASICRPCAAGFTRVRRVNEIFWGRVFLMDSDKFGIGSKFYAVELDKYFLLGES